ncbi:MAG TPA: response regulator [Ignavibacteriaceae bacterium]|nr:response regulator [Ignavibacteriaceae bacterium]
MEYGLDIKKPKILITEDDFENQRFLKLFLKKNFDVYMCDSDQTFYECIKDTKFDVILMDISLRGKKNGLQLTKELKETPGYEDIPIVCLTAHAFKKDRDTAMEAGVNVFLTKPVENHILMETLLGVLKK